MPMRDIDLRGSDELEALKKIKERFESMTAHDKELFTGQEAEQEKVTKEEAANFAAALEAAPTPEQIAKIRAKEEAAPLAYTPMPPAQVGFSETPDLPASPPANNEQIPDAVAQQLKQMAELQAAQMQTMQAMKNQLDEAMAKNEKLERELGDQKKRVNDGQVHYQLPTGLTEEQDWNLQFNDPRGVLG